MHFYLHHLSAFNTWPSSSLQTLLLCLIGIFGIFSRKPSCPPGGPVLFLLAFCWAPVRWLRAWEALEAEPGDTNRKCGAVDNEGGVYVLTTLEVACGSISQNPKNSTQGLYQPTVAFQVTDDRGMTGQRFRSVGCLTSLSWPSG